MPFDCNCRGLNFQKEFTDASESYDRINEALDFAFENAKQPRPDSPEDLRDALLANGGEIYIAFYTKLFDNAPGCARICTGTLLHITNQVHSAKNAEKFELLSDEQYNDIRFNKIPDDVEDAAKTRRELQRKPN